MEPELVILHVVKAGERWQDVEREFIASAVERGWRLTNTTAGGEGLDYMNTADSEKHRFNLSTAMKVFWSTPDRREEARQRSLKAWSNPVITEKRLAAVRRAHATDSLKERMREIGREIGSRPEVKAAKSEKMKQYVADQSRYSMRLAIMSSPATRAKMSASAKARFAKPGSKSYLSTPEARARTSASAKRRATPEYRAMMAEKARQSWSKRRA